MCANSDFNANDLPMEIPIVDFGQFLNGDDAARRACAETLFDAFHKYGFVYIVNHGVPKDLRNRAFSESKGFFDLSMTQKLNMGWTSPESNRGYSALGREQLDLSKPADFKESFEIGNENEKEFENRWPENGLRPNFRSTCLELWNVLFKLHLELLRALGLKLNLDNDFFDKTCGNECNNLRLLHYPPTATAPALKPGQQRAGAHTDYGTLTLLMQDDVGGLEVLHPDGKTWIAASPIEDAIIINSGDLMQQWTNDVLKSDVHRVVLPEKGERAAKPRYSIAYFCNPNKDTMITCLPGCGTPKYEPIRAIDHLVMKLKNTY
eukprot:ANDGO_00398.mRNA.1 UPF0676 protein C1494.01